MVIDEHYIVTDPPTARETTIRVLQAMIMAIEHADQTSCVTLELERVSDDNAPLEPIELDTDDESADSLRNEMIKKVTLKILKVTPGIPSIINGKTEDGDIISIQSSLTGDKDAPAYANWLRIIPDPVAELEQDPDSDYNFLIPGEVVDETTDTDEA